jgi:replicative DNA helicase
LKDLDRITGGWQKGELVILAARPAMGKTAIAVKLMESAALSGEDVAMFALEMKGERLVDRIILERTGILDWLYKQGDLTNAELDRIASTSSYLYRLPVYIDDNSSQTISRIKSKCRFLQKKGHCKLIIIDYLQLAESEGNTNNREQEVARISREAKKMAKALDVPVIMLSQLNRAVESRPDKRPMLSDIRESGAIEQDADMVVFIHRPGYYNHKMEYNGREIPNGIELIIAKYREGAIGSVYLQHDGSVRNIKDCEWT